MCQLRAVFDFMAYTQKNRRLLLRPPAIAAARSIAISLSVCLSHHVHNVHIAPDQSRASISGRDLISPGVANGTAVALPSMPEISELVANFQGVAK